ncbi:hypothetical protein CsSME_00051347 [Camellia sinensis var. sinensis]
MSKTSGEGLQSLSILHSLPNVFFAFEECASLSSIPRGKWYCKYCQNMFQREKFVEHNANVVAAGRVLGVDLIEQITKRCIRIVKNPEYAEVIACVLCRGYQFRKSGFGPHTVIVCDQYRMKSVPVVDLGERKIDIIITQSAVIHMLEECAGLLPV